MIEFPNHSRSYDQTRRAVRFWGHDSALEATFFIDEGALRRIQPDTRPDEPSFLNAFDCNRDDMRGGCEGLRPWKPGILRPSRRKFLKRTLLM